jgi:hypothetical protein
MGHTGMTNIFFQNNDFYFRCWMLNRVKSIVYVTLTTFYQSQIKIFCCIVMAVVVVVVVVVALLLQNIS